LTSNLHLQGNTPNLFYPERCYRSASYTASHLRWP